MKTLCYLFALIGVIATAPGSFVFLFVLAILSGIVWVIWFLLTPFFSEE